MIIIFYFKLDAVIILHIQHFINKVDVDFLMNQIENRIYLVLSLCSFLTIHEFDKSKVSVPKEDGFPPFKII
jgi:hypothetical protein